MRVAGESLSGESGWGLTGLSPGSLVAGYRVESRLGTGGMAMVLRARDENLGRTVALKILAPALAGDAEFRERFVREARAVAAVDHPHIIPVYAAGQAGGVLYLAMRFVVGGDLTSVLRREGPLAGDRAVALLAPIAAALDMAHAAGLVHRDVKPANILVDSSPGRPEHPYLSDFGLAKGSSSAAGLTGTGQFLGTPDYAAPEQISGKATGPQTDQYALACVAYTMITGSPPFAREAPLAVLWAHVYDQPPALTASRPDLPAVADQVIARALAKSPADRYATCGEFADALRAALAAPAGARSGAAPASRGPAPESARSDTVSLPPQPVPAGRPAPAAPSATPRPPLPLPPEVTAARDQPILGAATVPPATAAASETADPGWIQSSWLKRHQLGLVLGAVILLVGLLGGGGAWVFVQRQYYYVGVSDGHVAIFRGSNEDFLGISLSTLDTTSTLPVRQLRASDQATLAETIRQSSAADARQLINQLQSQADRCERKWKAVAAWQAEKAKAPLGGNPGPQPTAPDAATCASASAFGINLSSPPR